MLFSRKPTELPTAETALKGRPEAIPTASTHFVNGRSLKGGYPAGMELAQFGMGCFWGVERIFWQAPGVWVTAVGYAGGVTPNPTYEEACSGRTGHTEAVLVVFDPKVVSYEDLLDGRPQSVRRNEAGAFQLFRIGDAVAARNTHAAIYDALRLAKDL